MIAFNTGSGADVVTVDAGAMQDLTDKYTKYRQTIDREFFDPVRAMTLTGEVLASVRKIVLNGRATDTAEANDEEPPR